MQPGDDARFLVCYIHVAKQSTSAVIDAMRSFRAVSSSETCHVACLQRDGDCYSNQFVIFIAANDPAQLVHCTASSSFVALSGAIDAARIAPTIIKKFRSVTSGSPSHSSEFMRHTAGASSAIFSVTHLDVIPSIPGNVDRAVALLAKEASARQELRGVDGCFMFFGLQQTDRANHFSFVQGWSSTEVKSAYDEGAAMAFKEEFYGMGPLVGGCPWDEQFHTCAI
jgi:hypothetical protein